MNKSEKIMWDAHSALQGHVFVEEPNHQAHANHRKKKGLRHLYGEEYNDRRETPEARRVYSTTQKARIHHRNLSHNFNSGHRQNGACIYVTGTEQCDSTKEGNKTK